ncbi:MAG: SH3 domain-containing protein [Eubacteriales bacterium]|nr:SH3 domain-containing protein [Eubacteriales bacterium]
MAFNRIKFVTYCMTAAMIFGAMGLPAQAVEASAKTTKLAGQLPSAGFSYAMSSKKVSLKDVEDSLAAAGKISVRKTVQRSAGVSSVLSVSSTASKEASGILETDLTQKQQEEKEKEEAAQAQQETSAESASGAGTTQKTQEESSGSAPAEEASDGTSASQSSGGESAAENSESAAETGDTSSESETASDSAEKTSESASQGTSLAVATVNDYVNVRSEATTDSDTVGKLYSNGVATVLEKEDNGWLKIESGDVVGYVKEDYVATGDKAAELADAAATKVATVNTETLRVRAAATLDSDVITLIPGGEEFTVEEEENGWYKITTEDGEGYIMSDFADVEEEYPEAESKQAEEARLAAEQAEKEKEEKKKAEEEQKKADEAAKAAEEAAQASSAAASTETTESSDTAASDAAAQEEAAKKAAEEAAAAQKAADEAAAAQKKAEEQAAAAASAAAASESSTSAAGQEVASFALQYVGNPYVWGGTSLTNGADCSGFVLAVYKNFGYSLPHNDAADRSVGTAVSSLAEAQPGDLICYSGHVGIYIGGGQIVHASNPASGIKVSNAAYRNIVAIRRVIQ